MDRCRNGKKKYIYIYIYIYSCCRISPLLSGGRGEYTGPYRMAVGPHRTAIEPWVADCLLCFKSAEGLEPVVAKELSIGSIEKANLQGKCQ